jgi:nucleotide-binding universal stress UspA family protein
VVERDDASRVRWKVQAKGRLQQAEVRAMFERILLAIDGSPEAERGIPIAQSLASVDHGEVIVFHVMEREVTLMGTFPLEYGKDATELVDGIVRRLKDSGVAARGDLQIGARGWAAHEIVEAAVREDVDLIIMGSRGLSKLSDLLLGGVTNKVLHLSDRPVLVVR